MSMRFSPEAQSNGNRSVSKGALYTAPATPFRCRQPAQQAQPVPVKTFAARTAHSQTVKTYGAHHLGDRCRRCRHLPKVSKFFAKHHIDVICSITQNQELFMRGQTMIPTDAVPLSPCLIPEHWKHFGTVPFGTFHCFTNVFLMCTKCFQSVFR